MRRVVSSSTASPRFVSDARTPESPIAQGEPPDELLVARAIGGDETAVGMLFDRHAATLLSLAHAIVRESGEAEDVVAATFSQCWRDLRRYDPARGSVATWFVMVTRSRALDVLRSRRRLARRLTRVSHTFLDEEATGPADVDPAATPDIVAERRALATAVRASLAELPAAQRHAIELAFFDGLTHADIAAQSGEPLGTVKSRIRLGMRRLREVLHGWGPESGVPQR
ncbi:MAG: sigma-70 family RNA polymerase sigma factor [Gemmatimonadaceae bacterium]|jgi:RNA polymerase sigma-70 factor (ECF subfamily)|nr:sigma-70 family RNA polymerase sigma factor [Gemmatimonadaceae bacterium]